MIEIDDKPFKNMIKNNFFQCSSVRVVVKCVYFVFRKVFVRTSKREYIYGFWYACESMCVSYKTRIQQHLPTLHPN